MVVDILHRAVDIQAIQLDQLEYLIRTKHRLHILVDHPILRSLVLVLHSIHLSLEVIRGILVEQPHPGLIHQVLELAILLANQVATNSHHKLDSIHQPQAPDILLLNQEDIRLLLVAILHQQLVVDIRNASPVDILHQVSLVVILLLEAIHKLKVPVPILAPLVSRWLCLRLQLLATQHQ
jgi:hypothetical protein